MTEKIKEEKKYDLVDLIGGIGIGLSFSRYFPVGILLIAIAVIIALLHLSEEKKT